MDWDDIKLIGVVISLVSGALTVGEKLCKWGKSAYQSLKKIHSATRARQNDPLNLGSYSKLTHISPAYDIDISIYASCPRQYYYRYYM